MPSDVLGMPSAFRSRRLRLALVLQVVACGAFQPITPDLHAASVRRLQFRRTTPPRAVLQRIQTEHWDAQTAEDVEVASASAVISPAQMWSRAVLPAVLTSAGCLIALNSYPLITRLRALGTLYSMAALYHPAACAVVCVIRPPPPACP